jgi:SAM-dependent methyltransferase
MLDTKGFTDKDSKREEYRSLYENDADYVEAYSKHTDMRIQNDGPALAIGGDWESHGLLQLQFLKSRGLTPDSRLLDLGCGTGRFARRVVPYLKAGKYVGLDISEGALSCAKALSKTEGWARNSPLFLHGDGSLDCVKHLSFDFIWAHSICTHLPPDLVIGLFAGIAEMDFGEFCFTYKKRDKVVRTGLKQFGYTPEWIIAEAGKFGLVAAELPEKWPQGQSGMRVVRG